MAESHLLSIVIADQRISGAKVAADKRQLALVCGDSQSYTSQEEIWQALATVVENCEGASLPSRIALGPEFFFFRTIELPFSDKKQIASILSYEIQDTISLVEHEYVYDYLVIDEDETATKILAIVLKKEIIRELLLVLERYDLDPEVVTVSGVPGCHNAYRILENSLEYGYLLNIGSRYSGIYRLMRGGVTLIRSIPVDPELKANFVVSEESNKLEPSVVENVRPVFNELGRTLYNTVLSIQDKNYDSTDVPWYIGGVLGAIAEYRDELARSLSIEDKLNVWQSHTAIDGSTEFLENCPPGLFDEVLALATCQSRDLQQINLRKDEFVRKYDRKRLLRIVRTASILLLGLAVTAGVGLGFEFQRMKTDRDELESKIRSIYKETIPESGRIVNPLQQLQVKVNELKNATSTGASNDSSLNTLVLLGDISERIPEALKVTFQRYIYDRKSIRIKGLTDNFNTVDQMKRSLDKSPYFREVAIVSANVAPKNEGVRFELKLQLD